MNSNNPSPNWQKVSKSNPCPICEKGDWCRVSADGVLVACRRKADGAHKVKTDKSGAPVYIHRIGAANGSDDGNGYVHPGHRRQASAGKSPPIGPASGAAVEKADADTLDRAYRLLLDQLPLNDKHRATLRQRGLTDVEIDRRGYRSYSFAERKGAATLLLMALREGSLYERVPGFIRTKRGPALAGPEGMLVPIRDPAGRIVAFKVRRDASNGDKSKYVYVSSTKHGGPGPGAPAHIPLGIVGPVELVRLTEGELKADVATALSGVPTIGAPSAAGWRACLPSLKALGAKSVRVALDADARRNAHVARAMLDCFAGLAKEGYAVDLERWDESAGKGIDDVLAAGNLPGVLTGGEALAAVKEIAKAAGVTNADEAAAAALGRLEAVLSDGGPAALFRDAELLGAVAQLKRGNPAEFAAVRERLRQAGLRMRELDAAIKPLLRQARDAEAPASQEAERYTTSETGCICRVRQTEDGPVESPLCNFDARIVEQVTHDDGAERRNMFAVEGSLMGGCPLPRVEVDSDDFHWMQWPVNAWGTHAVVYAGRATQDHLRAALQLLSGDAPRRIVYGHTGWREVEGRWCYLHASGAIGPDGPAAGVSVGLSDTLARYALPAPPTGAALVEAVRASLRLSDVAPPRIVFPLLAAVYRAPLGGIDFALHLAGQSGVFKSELAALAQQHYGAGLDARHLPGSWLSTGNALEGIAFAAKDALLAVDDFAPAGTTADVQRFHREADRLLRAQGNQAGRQRMRADGTLRPTKPPRGLIVSTGEDVPRGQSLRARLLVAEVGPGDVDKGRLTACQGDAREGQYAAALAGYLRWLAPKYAAVRAGLTAETARLRDAAAAEGQHARTPGIVADLAIGLLYLLRFAVEVGALTADAFEETWRQGWAALGQAAEAQAGHQTASEPGQHFLRLLWATVASGRAHVANPNGGQPDDSPEAWGWRSDARGTSCEWEPLGKRVGWTDGESLYLEPEASFAEAQKLAGEQGESLVVSPRTLWRRLRDRGALASIDRPRETLTVRRTVEGRRRDVIHLHLTSLTAQDPTNPTNWPTTSENSGGHGQVAGRVSGRVPPATADNPTAGPDQFPVEKVSRVGLVGSSAVESRDMAESNPRSAGAVEEGDA
ncbi:MAG TPA: DUF927 domain-containing protein [Pirellulales bacterium]|nr:DUF927 domain-containing protein [Pirellulales bacterium]